MKNICISGLTCSGKTTLSKNIEERLKDVLVIHEDNYYKNLSDIPKAKGYYLMDCPNAFYTLEFIEDMNALLNNGIVNIPKYEYKRNMRIGREEVQRRSINIFEGLHTISLLGEDKIKVFLDTPIEECLKRKIKRDSEYGVSEEIVRSYFNTITLPLYRTYIEPQKRQADIVIRKDGDIECLLMKLVKD